MSEFKNLLLDVEDEIAVLTINRPAALNALNSETLDELNVCLSEIEVKKINERLKGKISSRKGNTTKKAVVWMGRAAVIMLGCLTIGGGVYAAALYRKNVKNDLRIKASESKCSRGAKGQKRCLSYL